MREWWLWKIPFLGKYKKSSSEILISEENCEQKLTGKKPPIGRYLIGLCNVLV